MPKYGFKYQFHPFIKDFTKTGTIRGFQKHPAKPGDYIYHYPPRWSKPYTRLIEPQLCTDVKTIFILPNGSVFEIDAIMDEQDSWPLLADDAALLKLQFQSDMLTKQDKDLLAWADGFRDPADPSNPDKCFKLMHAWWEKMHGLATTPFAGHHIFWK